VRRQQDAQAKAAKRRSEPIQEAEARRQQEAQAKKRKRDSETEEATKKRKMQDSTATQQQRIKQQSAVQSIQEVSQVFISAVKEGPDYICACCHRLMYRKTVLEFKISKYTKAPQEFATMSERTSAKDKVWICKTCDYALRRGRMPAQAIANKLDLEDTPTELSDLNPLEERLICLRIPFMKMVALPCGKQRAIHGPAVNVPTDLTPVCTLLPRLPSQAQMVPMKLKRKLCYKGHYMYQYVRPVKVLAALEWLRANNPLYRDVQINGDWLADAAQDDADLWEALSAQHCPLPVQDGSNTNTRQQDANRENSSLPVVHVMEEDASQHIIQDMATLNLLARERGFIVRDVPRDGNCLFTAVEIQLQRYEIRRGDESLREQLVTYLQRNPYTHDGTCHLREFVAAPVVSADAYNADTEVPNDEDLYINSVEDAETRQELRWCKYLESLKSTAWGDHIAVQGLADMLHADIRIISTIDPDMEPITTSHHTPVGVIHLGLIGQFHYQALQMAEDPRPTPGITTASDDCQRTSTAVSTSTEDHQPTPNGNTASIGSQPPASREDCEKERIEDEEAFNDQAQLRGLPYDSCLQREDLEMTADNVFCVAPGEGQKPIGILTDEHFEEMCNPTKYPGGKLGLMSKREVKLTVRKFFNQRLLDADGRFAKDIEYLLTAQYAVESKQVADDASIMLRQTQGRLHRGQALTAGTIRNQQVVQQMIQRDDAYRFLKNVRGSPAYFQKVMYDVLGMIRQLGLPTWFLTLSAADMQWPDVIQTIARQYGTILTEEDVKSMSFEDKSKWLRQNPVTAARHFQYRLNTFFQMFLKSNAHPLGELVDYAIRIEFQARGSPHAHTILWIKDAPKLGVDSDEDVCNFIDQYISCSTPDDAELAHLVLKVQKHRHSATCRRNGHCRFHYPRPPSPQTLIAHEFKPEMCSKDQADDAIAALLTVRKVLDDKDTPEDISLDELLDKAKVSNSTYLLGLKICSTGNTVVMQRRPSECWINTYNPDVIKVWKANMDLQYILDPYACVMYIASYMLKSERSMGELLKQVSKECDGEQIRTQLRRLGSVFLNHREVSAQEAVYRILSLPLKQLSRKVVFLNTASKEERVSLLKPISQIEGMEDESEDIFQTSLIDRYAERPDTLSDLCLAEFAANYTTQSRRELKDGDTSDALPPPEDEDSRKCQRIVLKNGLGHMYKRRREAIVRFHRFNREKEASKMYRSKLMLYLPWRNENADLLGGYPDFRSDYEQKCDDIVVNELKFSHNATLINEAMDDLTKRGPPQHAWDQVAPGASEQQARDQAEGIEEVQNIEQEDLDANAQIFQQQQTTPLLQRFNAETNRELMPADQYRAMMRGLNCKQKQVVSFHRRWCKSAVIAMKTGQPIQPYRVFLSGPGGVGKSHVISLIHRDTVKLLRLSGQVQPDDVTVLLTAPTGVAAFNIQGMTVHSALLLTTSKFSNQPLTQDKLNTLRTKLSNLQLLIIDEISMVGSNMLLQIHKRLQQLKGRGDESTFGNVSILAVGDLFQLQPVAQPHVFAQVGDAYARLHRSGSLWRDDFSMIELDEIMRQREDGQFAQLLCRVRTATCTEQDIDMLRSRGIEDDDPNYPHDSVHVYRLNADVDEQNISKLKDLAPEHQHTVIRAIDCTKDKHTRQLDLHMPSSKANTGGLVTELHLAVGAKVMLTVNVDVSDGLVNGARGTVEGIIHTSNEVSVVLVKFDHSRVGVAAIAKSHYRDQYPGAVPISRHEAVFNIGRNKTAEVSRRQFPLVLAWATTIHKVQGLTLHQIVVDMKGRSFSAGQAYVAFSRVKSLEGLFIKNFNPSSIKVSEPVVTEMERLGTHCLPPEPVPQVVSLPKHNWIKIGHLNVRSYMAKQADVKCDLPMSHVDIMCFTETFLKPHHHIRGDLLLNPAVYEVFRLDRVTTSNQDLSNGGIMIACATSLLPETTNISHPALLEIKSIIVITSSNLRMCVVAVYRRPQLPLATFLPLLNDYLSRIPHQDMPTVVLGDFNEDLLSTASSSRLLTMMSSKGFSQLVKVPTTDSGSLLDHIYYNGTPTSTAVNVVDIYYSDHDATYVSLPL
jgi:DNA replication protein DnaC